MGKVRRDEQGYTLLEILIVMIIIGVLVATVGPELFNRVNQAEQTAAKNQINVLKIALDNYRLDNGQYPTTQQGLTALIANPTTPPLARNWLGPYLEKQELPLDPWGYQYNYQSPGKNNQHKYDLWSYGADNREGGTGEKADVTNW